MKKSLFTTRTIVATGLGAALFFVLFMYVKIPSPVPNTNLQLAYGVSSFFGAVFGPLAGFLIAFIGHALTDFLSYGSPWWSWVIASGISGLITGFAFFKLDTEKGKLAKADMIRFLVWVLLGQAIAWGLAAPLLDVAIYAEPMELVFAQSLIAFTMNSITSLIVGGILLFAYTSRKVAAGTLSKKD